MGGRFSLNTFNQFWCSEEGEKGHLKMIKLQTKSLKRKLFCRIFVNFKNFEKKGQTTTTTTIKNKQSNISILK